jgi:hypothetical protein
MKRKDVTSANSVVARKRTINLGRESLRVLTDTQLHSVAGGTATSVWSFCATDCRKTL